MNDPFEGEIVKPEPRDGFYDDAERYGVCVDGMRELLKVRPVNLELWSTPGVTNIG